MGTVWDPEGCERGPDHHFHPAPAVAAGVAFVVAGVAGPGLVAVVFLILSAAGSFAALRHAET